MLRALPFGLPAAAVVVLAFAGCAKDPLKPAEGVINGQVTNGSGQPIAAAEVSLSFELAAVPAPARPFATRRPRTDDIAPVIGPRSFFVSNNPCSLGVVAIQLSAPDTSVTRLEILDRHGASRRVLAIRTFQPGIFSLQWDGHDDLGNLLPPDLYTANWTDVEGDSTFHFSLPVLWEATTPDRGVNAFTRADGRFTISLADLPIGESFESVDPAGDTHGQVTIRPVVSFVVRAQVGGVTHVGHLIDVDLGNLKADVPVLIQLP